MKWERVDIEDSGIYCPELVRIKIPEGWIYASCQWDEEKDAPSEQGWRMIFVRDKKKGD